MIRQIVTIIANILPKQDKITLIPYPDWEDMTLALLEKLQNKNSKIILLVGNESSKRFFKETLFSNLKIIKRTKLKGVYHIITSKTIFCTHGLLLKTIPRGTTIINLWHGFGFKAVGTYLSRQAPPSTIVIGSSEYSRKFFAQEMNVDIEKVIPLGFCRNDRLINACMKKEEIKKELGFDKFHRIIIWMPTFRSSIEGDIRLDGIQYNNPFNLEKFNIEHFLKFLKEKNILCLFRAHPMSLKFELPQSEYFQVTNDDWLNQKGLSLYQLTGITDLLVSDVSSIITDYLLIDKPIIHAMSDLDEYIATRPMLLNPPEDFFVGPLARDQQTLTDEIINSFNNSDTYDKKRQELKKIFFDNNTDNKSTERVLNYLKLV